MAIKDKAVTIKGDLAFVTCVTIFPQANGSAVITVAGQTKDSEGRHVALKEAQMTGAPRQNAALDDLLTLGLSGLRKVNGLEDAPLSLEPKADAVVADAEVTKKP